MPRHKIMNVAILNMVIHPHSDELYTVLFRDVFQLRRRVKVRGSDHILIGNYRTDENNISCIIGNLYKFVDIDPTATWLDTFNLTPALDVDGEPINPIPSNLAPNLRMIPFVFFINGHRLFYDKDYLSPLSASKAIYALFNQPEIFEKYGEVMVSLESTDESIQQIMRIPSLTKLNIFIGLPNPDDLSELEQRVEERIRNQKARKYKQEYTGTREEGLQPDEETEAVMRLALSNGYVNAEGWEDNTKIEKSTLSHPKVIKEKYNPEAITAHQFLINIGQRILPSLTGRR